MTQDQPGGTPPHGEGAPQRPDDEESTAVTPPAAPGEERTVIAPAAAEERTVVAPSTAHVPPPPAPDIVRGATSMTVGQFAPRQTDRAVQVGDILNNTYEVKRFLARGGMGEVFEGSNVISEERVAIKVMLPALAADPNVIELFKKEAKTLTKFSHEALVKYRQISQSKEFGVLYMVTEFIDGKNLADVLGSIQPTDDELVDLLRRLASGMAVAHDYGAVHRDLSPDNVMLDGGSLSRPKIIDFGIAKDLDAGAKTVIGEGFAGKLNYVAPEQLGAFDRAIGPWTDVYSLALVILAVIHGKNVPMGGSLIDAVKKRESVPDLSKAPEVLRPVLDKMLQPDPKQRYQNMHEVVAALPGGTPQTIVVEQKGVSKPVLIGGAIGLVAIIGLGIAAFTGSDAPKIDPVERARTTLAATLPKVECSWLSVGGIEGGQQVAISMRGVAGSPDQARGQIYQALTAAGVPNPTLNFDDVAFIRPEGCSALSALGQIRRPGGGGISVPQPEFERVSNLENSNFDKASRALVTVKPQGAQNFTLLGIEPADGKVTQIIPDRQTFESLPVVEQVQPGEYQLTLDMDHIGWTGLILITGDGPFDEALLATDDAKRTLAWRSNFLATASERDWKSEMIWFRSVDKNPND
jgi:eukaryotic-like serine/threonine-protein kinase